MGQQPSALLVPEDDGRSTPVAEGDDDGGACFLPWLGTLSRQVQRALEAAGDGAGGAAVARGSRHGPGGAALGAAAAAAPGAGFGTPVPDTPAPTRRKRELVQEQLREEQERQSRGALGAAAAAAPRANGGSGGRVHDGPAAEQELHASYQLLEVLGVGSTSTVHRCVRKEEAGAAASGGAAFSGEYFACKVIDCRLMEERFQGMLGQFQTEIQALQELRHDGIIRLFDVYIVPGDKIYIIMELMEGGELFDYVVQKGTLTEEEASKIVRKVTSAIAFMHSRNYIHRDLKPENLLLKRTPKSPYEDIDVKIIDFGLSKVMEQPHTGTFLGTRGYLSPEQLSRRDYTKAVDSWALGVIVFVLLCGCLPFDDDSSAIASDELLRVKFALRYPRWAKNLSPSAKDLLSHLLDTNPLTRYTADQALDHPWVRGVTAPKDNVLASPGKIKKSPMLMGSGRAGRFTPGGTRRRQQERETPPPTPQAAMIRKGSI